MTLRPVDMQIVIQKASELVKNQYQEHNKVQLQQQIAQQVQNNAEKGDRQVNTLQSTYRSQIKNGREKEQKEEKGKGKRNKKNQKGSVIDIKI